MKKASERIKVSVDIKDVENRMAQQETSYDKGVFKAFFPHWVYVSDEIKMQLINNGYKVYIGDWDHVMKNALIIEW